MVDWQVQILGGGEAANEVGRKRLLGGALDLLCIAIHLHSICGGVPVLFGGGVSLLVGTLLPDLGEDLLQDKVGRRSLTGVLRSLALQLIQNLSRINSLHRSDRYGTLDSRHQGFRVQG